MTMSMRIVWLSMMIVMSLTLPIGTPRNLTAEPLFNPCTDSSTKVAMCARDLNSESKIPIDATAMMKRRSDIVTKSPSLNLLVSTMSAPLIVDEPPDRARGSGKV